MGASGEVLLDVTRLVAGRWSGRPSNGIDRVAYAYLDHFASRARAVVQLRGIIRVLTRHYSEQLFAILQPGPVMQFRRRLGMLAPRALLAGGGISPESFYINVTHTDFDLPRHWDWVSRNHLRSIYLIHDLIPILHPEFCRPHAVVRHRERVHAALKGSSGIVVNSHATADSLASYVQGSGLASPPVLAASIAGATLRPGWEGAKASPFPGLWANGYVLCVGTIEPRKNHELLLDVWLRLAQSRGDDLPGLVLVGKWGALSEAVRHRVTNDPALSGLVQVWSTLDDAQLAPLMANAIAVLQPSLAEGFGLPVCEALAMGTPVIASDLPSHREIARGQAQLLDPHDAGSWERAINDAIRQPTGQEARRSAAISYRAPTWQEHFQQLDTWLAELDAHGH
jgi:glycosyltransferase involved in cell wall biosynthesis